MSNLAGILFSLATIAGLIVLYNYNKTTKHDEKYQKNIALSGEYFGGKTKKTK